MMSYLIQKLRNSAPLRSFLQGHFFTSIPLLFRLGHFYSPIVHPKDARSREVHLWKSHDEMSGVDLQPQAQLALLKQLGNHTISIDYPVNKPLTGIGYFYSNDQFPALDAEFLHTMLCHLSPKTMIEVGSGFSSLITAHVNQKILKGALDFICIEPYPRKFLTNGVPGINKLIQKKVEDVELEFFDRLHAGDILFIDSSHVNYLFFEVIPRLRKGVYVHIHDIFLPDEYPKTWVLDQGRNWNEQYLLRAFLQYNTEWEIVWAANFMGTRHTGAVQKVFPRYPDVGGGGSFWIRKI
jgi:hypothetical protein